MTDRKTKKIDSQGEKMYDFLAKLFPLSRSLTGAGTRETLKIIGKNIPLKIYEVKSGTNVFDWTIPKEWNIKDAYIVDENGKKIVDFKKNNLHIVGYSIPIDKWVSRAELEKHLHSIKEQPEAIPYVTSYYQEDWGFCLSHKQRETLKEGKYRVVIDSELKNGHLSYGECIIKGK